MGWLVFGKKPIPAEAPASSNPFTLVGRNVLYGDQINDTVVVEPTQALARGFESFDRTGIDGATDGAGYAFRGLSTQLRRLQTGYARSYALTMVAGAILVGLVLILSHLG